MCTSNLEAKQMWNRIKTNRHHDKHLKPNDQRKTCQKFSSSVNVLKPAQETWEQQHNSRFDWGP